MKKKICTSAWYKKKKKDGHFETRAKCPSALKKKICTSAWYKKKKKDGHFETRAKCPSFLGGYHIYFKCPQQMFVKHVATVCRCIPPWNIYL